MRSRNRGITSSFLPVSKYVMKGQSEYRFRMKKTIEDQEYVKWMFMLGEYYRG
jgi:hypothetical protein